MLGRVVGFVTPCRRQMLHQGSYSQAALQVTDDVMSGLSLGYNRLTKTCMVVCEYITPPPQTKRKVNGFGLYPRTGVSTAHRALACPPCLFSCPRHPMYRRVRLQRTCWSWTHATISAATQLFHIEGPSGRAEGSWCRPTPRSTGAYHWFVHSIMIIAPTN